MIRVFSRSIYLFSGYLADFPHCDFVLMMLLSPAALVHQYFRRAMISFPGAWRQRVPRARAHVQTRRDDPRRSLIDRLNDRVRHYGPNRRLLVGVGFIGFFAWHAAVMTWQSWKFSTLRKRHRGTAGIPQLGYSGCLVIFSSLLWMN